MGLPFISNGAKKNRDQMVAIDLGGRTSKAVYLTRRGEGLVLSGYALVDAPLYEKSLSAELLGEHVKAVVQALDAKTKSIAFGVGVNDAVVRHTELPRMPVEDMRLVLKNNPKGYMQQDLPNYVFDCFNMPIHPGAAASEAGAKSASAATKQRVLAAGAKQQLVNDFLTAARTAGVSAEMVFPGLIGPVNAFEVAMPEQFAKEAVALVDVGFRNTTISVLKDGELILSRVVALAGDKLTSGLAESMGISYAEAEGIKVGMAAEVQSVLESILAPLGRELRASIDFFEHQHDRTVTQAYISGGSSKSEFIINTLQNEMMVECKTWNPAGTLQLELPPTQMAELEHVAPLLTVAIGTALAAL
ncbi:MAG: hypothetical protein EPO07_19620 [Verrucomicrobia bacterium]|nr:MAG: hypothetical protein EPO07_19620 [Verrucomicrobiota bacterium]